MSPSMMRHVVGLAGLALAGGVAAVEPADPAALWTREGATLRELSTLTAGPERAEMLWRLGLWERDASKRLLAGGAGPEIPQSIREVAAAHADAAEQAFSEAVALATAERRPTVLYELGDLRRSRGRIAEAREPLERLLADHRDDPLAIDAAVALGEDAYDAGRLADAIERYRFARRHGPGSFAAAYATYKLAWCRLELEEFAAARKLFRDVLARRDESRPLASLADDALKDLVLALARDGSVTAPVAEQEVRRVAPGERWRGLLESYARLVASSGRDAEAAALLARLEPGAAPDQAASLLVARLEIALRRRDLPEVRVASSRLAAVLPRVAPDSETLPAAEVALRSVAVTLHGEGRSAKKPATLETALQAYLDYFVAFDAREAAYELHHHAGELLASLGRHAEAERHYTAAVLRDVARLEAEQPAGKWLESSARGAVLEAEAALAPAPAAPAASTGEHEEQLDRPVPAPVPLEEAEAIFIAACDRYLSALPDGADVPSIAYRRGFLLFRRAHYADAVPGLALVATRYPAREEGAYAARLALASLKELGRYDELAKLANRFRGLRALAEPMGPELSQVAEGALLAGAARAALTGEHADAVARYEAFLKAHPRSTRRDRALFNGAGSLTALRRSDEAVAWRSRLLSSVPDSPLAARTRELQLADLVQFGRFAESVGVAVAVAEAAPRDKAAAALHDAIVLAEAGGRLAEADRLRATYLKSHPHAADALLHALSLADRAKGCRRRTEGFTKALRHAPQPAGRAVLLVRLARESLRCGQEGKARWYAKEATKLEKKLPAEAADARDAVAEAALLLAAREHRAFREVRIRAPYEKTLPRKLGALRRLEAALTAVVRRGRAEPAVCALVGSGLAYAELGRELVSARAPRGFTEEQRTLFEEELSTRAQPLLDRAKEALGTALAQARETTVDPACLAEARAALAELWPERHGARADALLALAPTAGAGVCSAPCSATDILSRAPDAPAAWLLAARAELEAGRPRAALLLLERLAPDDPLIPQALEVRALALEATGRGELALAAWGRLAREFARRPLAHRVLADRALFKADPEGARRHLEALRTLVPDDVAVALDLGVVLRALGDPKAAEQATRAAFELAKERPEPALNLGLLLCGEAGRPAEGLPLLESAAGRMTLPAGASDALAACRALAKGAGR